ncbi:MAG: hypothetical protein ACRBHB_19495, partial [Arenicella sp.]
MVSIRHIKHNWISLWSLELSSIALSRICLGLILIVDLLARLSQVEVFYSVDGLAPPSLVKGSFPAVWNLYLLNDQLWYAKALISLNLVCALFWTVGYRGAWALVATWFLYASLFYRNSFIHSGAEVTLLSALFWMMWLPHSRKFSLDSKSGEQEAHPNVVSAGSVAYIGSIIIYYFFSGLNKSSPIWTSEGSALYYALNLDSLVSPAGVWLLSQSGTIQALTLLIWWLEVLSPL